MKKHAVEHLRESYLSPSLFLFERDGLQPVHKQFEIRVALATEGQHLLAGNDDFAGLPE